MQKFVLFILVFIVITGKLYAQNPKIDSLKSALKVAKDTSRVNTLNRLAQAYRFIDTSQLLSYSLKAKYLSTKIQYTQGLARALCSIGVYYTTTQEYEKSRSFFNQSLKFSSPVNYQLRTTLYHNLAFMEPDPTIQLGYLTKGLKSAKMINFKQIGFLYHALGTFYYNHTKYPQSFSYFIEGLNVSERLKDSVAISINLEGVCLVFNAQNDERSLNFCQRALNIAERLKSKALILTIKNTLAHYYMQKGKLDTAFILASQAFELAKQIDSKARITNSLSRLGEIRQLQGKQEEAIDYYNHALGSITREDEYWETCNALFGLGCTYNSMGKSGKAITYLQRALKLTADPAATSLKWDIYFELSQAYKKSSDFKKAYHYYELYHLTKDSIYSLESKEQIASIQAKYETDKKEQSIKILQKNNHIKDLIIAQSKTWFILISGVCLFVIVITFLIYNRYRIKVKANKQMKQANDEILNNVKEKEVLLQEIHHRVKNNLQLISSLLKWQGENVEDEKMLKIIGDGRSRIKSMALIHEALYQSGSLVYLNIKHYLNDLLGHLDKAYNKNSRIVLDKKIKSVSLDVDIVIPLGLIVTELISNSFKYAFPYQDEGLIHISLTEERPNLYTLQVGDNGIGFHEDIFLGSQSKTMGIHLIKLLVKQIKGTINICNENGTNFIISFEEVSYKTTPALSKEFQTTS